MKKTLLIGIIVSFVLALTLHFINGWFILGRITDKTNMFIYDIITASLIVMLAVITTFKTAGKSVNGSIYTLLPVSVIIGIISTIILTNSIESLAFLGQSVLGIGWSTLTAFIGVVIFSFGGR